MYEDAIMEVINTPPDIVRDENKNHPGPKEGPAPSPQPTPRPNE